MQNSDRRTRLFYILEAGFEYFISIFVSSTFLGYVLDAIGISDAWQGIILNVTVFSCGAQLFAIFLSGKRVKKIVTIGHSINQLCFTFIYILPIFPISKNIKIFLFFFFLFLGHILNNAINPSKINYLMESVPNSKRGSFTALKEMISLAGGMLISVLLGRIADTFRDTSGNPTQSYYIVCCIAIFLLTVLHTLTLIFSNEKEIPRNQQHSPIREVVKKILTSKEILKVIAVGVIWNFASAISTSFLASYLRQELAFSMTMITLLTTAGSLCRIVVSPLLGKLADRRSFAFSMTLCFFVMALAYLAIVFTVPGKLRWLYLVYICLHSFAMGGINSGVINLIYDYVIPEDRAAALGIQNTFGGIISFITSIAAGLLLAFIQSRGGVTLFSLTIYAQQILALLSVIVIIALIVYMRTVIAPMRRVEISESNEE